MRTAFEGKEYGFFLHFLNSGDRNAPLAERGQNHPLPPDRWSALVDQFDVKKLAGQFHELKAGYVFLTVGQNSGYYCSPNSIYAREVGPEYCSERDLILDFADALAEYGIDCYAYTTSLAPAYRIQALKNLQSVPPWNCEQDYSNYKEVEYLKCNDPRLRYFLDIWSQIHREWSLHWGTKIKGWWVDGCYYPEKIYDFPDEPNGASFCRALRAGNPDSVIAFNPGVIKPRRNYPGSDEDYTAGEINNPEFDLLDSQYVDDGLRYHILSYLGSFWGRGPMRGTGTDLAMFTRNVVDNGGVVSWDVPFTVNGIDQDIFAVLKDFASSYQESKTVFPQLSFRVKDPSSGMGSGTDRDGELELASSVPFELTVGWNGTSRKVNSPGRIPLPSLGGGEYMLEMERGGFRRSIPVFCGRKSITISENTSELFCLNNCSYRLSRSGNDFRVQAEIEESVCKPGSDDSPWEGSGLEIFIENPDKIFWQYCVRADGRIFQRFPEIKELSPAAFEQTSSGYRIDLLFPLPSKETFLLEIRQHIGVTNGFLVENLFGGRRSNYKYRDQYACITVMP